MPAGPSAAPDDLPSPPASAGLREWLLSTRELSVVKTALAARRASELARARRAVTARDRADALSRREPGEAAADDVLALTAWQQAAHWSLLALADDLADDCEPSVAAAALADGVGERLSLSKAHAAQIAELVGERTFVDLAALPAFERRQAADALREFVERALALLLAPERALSRLVLRRWLRVGAALAALAVVLGGIGWGVWLARRPPDLALTSKWKASSTYGGWNPTLHRVDGQKSTVFFHTNQDPSPWVQFDLGDGASFSSVSVENRRDCCTERASFLVVEVSPDSATWREIATHSGDFTTWTARFAPQRARHVRVRSLKQTWLHFERVSIR